MSDNDKDKYITFDNVKDYRFRSLVKNTSKIIIFDRLDAKYNYN